MTNAEELIGLSRQTRVALTGERDSNNIITAGARQSMAFLARVEMELARVVTLERERDELRAIVEGREEPPTNDEIAAHEKVDGWWRFQTENDFGELFAEEARIERDYGEVIRWWALDADGRPCAWPKVTP